MQVGREVEIDEGGGDGRCQVGSPQMDALTFTGSAASGNAQPSCNASRKIPPQPSKRRPRRHPGWRAAMRALGLLLLWAPSHAETLDCSRHAYQPQGLAADTPAASSFLVELRPADAPPSYVLGTFHSADPAVLEPWAPAILLLTTPEIRIFIAERDLAAAAGAEAQLLPAEASLETLLAGRIGLFQQTVALLAPLGLPRTRLDRLQPWFAAALLSQAPALSNRPGEPILDAYLQSAAAALAVEGRFLEDLTDLAHYYYQGFSPEEQIELLAEAVCNQGRLTELVRQQTRAYAANDVATFYRLSNAYTGADAALTEKLVQVFVRRRNAVFWPQLWAEIRRGGAFVVVGNAHVLAPDGLLALLRAEGEAVAVRELSPATLSPTLTAEDIPGLVAWVTHWLRGLVVEHPSAELFADLRLTAESLPAMRQRLCPGRSCVVEASYLPASRAVVVLMPLWARLLTSPETPSYRLGEDGLERSSGSGQSRPDPYAESVVVRELSRHALSESFGPELRRRLEGSANAAHCERNWLLHWAALAQQAYLRAKSAPEQAYPFPLDPRCPAFEPPGRTPALTGSGES